MRSKISPMVLMASVALATGILFTASWAPGMTIDWSGHLVLRPPLPPLRTYNGTFSDAINWSGGAVPGNGDAAQFNADQTYTVTFTNSPTNNSLLVPAGVVTFAKDAPPLLARTYTVGTADVGGSLTLNDVGL